MLLIASYRVNNVWHRVHNLVHLVSVTRYSCVFIYFLSFSFSIWFYSFTFYPRFGVLVSVFYILALSRHEVKCECHRFWLLKKSIVIVQYCYQLEKKTAPSSMAVNQTSKYIVILSQWIDQPLMTPFENRFGFLNRYIIIRWFVNVTIHAYITATKHTHTHKHISFERFE